MGSTQFYQYYTVWAADSTNQNSVQSFVLPYGLNATVEGSKGYGFNTFIEDG